MLFYGQSQKATFSNMLTCEFFKFETGPYLVCDMDLTLRFLSLQGKQLRKILLTRYFGNQKLLSKSELGSGNSSSGGFVKPSSGGTENPK